MCIPTNTKTEEKIILKLKVSRLIPPSLSRTKGNRNQSVDSPPTIIIAERRIRIYRIVLGFILYFIPSRVIAATHIAVAVIIRKAKRNVAPIGSGIRNAAAEMAIVVNETRINAFAMSTVGFGS